ncbi:MAG: ActS/PrrB/RegB family redox-sensitive histidine kinase [Paracoccaceae bacterium]|uniref:sensor histidine kinase RegB n=1 Tax=unclassified Seohaeicola TaxID=2641111 RepID=UPI00237A986D|nr:MULTISPECIES: ActS/PrrB/RegB family redox-sensitive histidine kinase [unclassified Seohaeicola]MDD9707823.1 ActS/PrrB/RegB family redox-sensitive histidine kinase [Seohaeicola sp. 4SK31]MDD9734819.1 ActS/PrrB/RegB family redox-sensitive histidine kinase [Seohaeicola sp. SP36]MDF1706770.1 ActS/PrrB/RegB family redox-sensitive histidine kinase [Paracoccaceae bacterium]MDM7968106.1 ActS/PrrB/RegB family redox-sensitive histidine kinase [Paracoccaceae bacterium]
MSDSQLGVLKGHERGNWVRLRTIILLRWGAVVGQLVALFVAQQAYNLQIEMALCLLVVSVSVMGNLIAMFIFPENKRLSETENLLMVLFDLLQLALLLYLTGGLHNPFYILILGPVTVSALVLTLRSTVFLGITAILAVTLLAEFHLPLRTDQGFLLRVPDIFVFGNWVAITIAVVFLSFYSRRVTQEMHSMSDALQATQMALAREQKLTDLGGVVAAAAHELGTPLATIKLTSAELIEELEDFPELQEDARLIRQQADRCRDILRSMGRAGKDDLMLRQAPLGTVVREAAAPHMNRGKDIHFQDGQNSEDSQNQPVVLRRPDLVHGLRNLLQNGVDFARANVWVETTWDEDTVSVRIMDDGMGYPPSMMGRIGDPFMRLRRTEPERSQRPEYEGMGLGLFIAKTLLERSGAELSFANGRDPYLVSGEQPEKCGAIVEVVWPRAKIDARSAENAVPMGENQRLDY